MDGNGTVWNGPRLCNHRAGFKGNSIYFYIILFQLVIYSKAVLQNRKSTQIQGNSFPIMEYIS
ncbi:hypothetical protein DSCO28_67610 [Desulfosarcina ovata subsp. sediminis]|uniref:Uncharacterized protein n=1 Tax=Desulfosarcina ovata subsp. sediminis TaxID=885957 RepID=A0A5K8A0T9_9BACT|nr:hypothetical protein DSCO28_67610 [Desulfosarcina ovata subsp. sediminis]